MAANDAIQKVDLLDLLLGDALLEQGFTAAQAAEHLRRIRAERQLAAERQRTAPAERLAVAGT